MNYIMDYCEKTDKLLNVDRIMLIILLFFLFLSLPSSLSAVGTIHYFNYMKDHVKIINIFFLRL